MSSRSPSEGLIKRFCDFLGWQTCFSGFLDWVAGWLVPHYPPLAPAGVGPLVPGSQPQGQPEGSDLRGLLGNLMMSGTKSLEHTRGDTDVGGTAWKAPTKPWKASDTPKECNEDILRGMHGEPCNHAGGYLNYCPKGTVSGWFWKYEVSGKIIYYVDCCSDKPRKHKVVCNWSKEVNWCEYPGKALKQHRTKYYCTLALEKRDLVISKDAAGDEFVDKVEIPSRGSTHPGMRSVWKGTGCSLWPPVWRSWPVFRPCGRPEGRTCSACPDFVLASFRCSIRGQARDIGPGFATASGHCSGWRDTWPEGPCWGPPSGGWAAGPCRNRGRPGWSCSASAAWCWLSISLQVLRYRCPSCTGKSHACG